MREAEPAGAEANCDREGSEGQAPIDLPRALLARVWHQVLHSPGGSLLSPGDSISCGRRRNASAGVI